MTLCRTLRSSPSILKAYLSFAVSSTSRASDSGAFLAADREIRTARLQEFTADPAEAEQVSDTENHQPNNSDNQPDRSAGLGGRAIRGAAVTLAGQGTKILIQITSVMILARLLSPEDYGLLVMITVIIGVTDIFRDFGLSSAAIQAPTLSRNEQINLFWVNTGLGGVLTAAAWLAAPLLAGLYGRPELISLTHFMAFMFLINGVSTQYRADLTRRMRFRALAITEVTSTLVGVMVALFLARTGAGVWALVAQQLSQVSVSLVLVVSMARWLPAQYRRDTPIKHFIAFGWRLASSQLVNYVGNNMDNLLLGLRVGAAPLGIYNRSYQLIMQPLGQIRGPLNTVAVPVLSRLQSEDDRYQNFVARGQMAMGYTIIAGLAFVAGTAGPLVSLALGDGWAASTNVLRLLAVAGGVTTLSYVAYWVYVTKGLMSHLLHFTFISVAIRITSVTIGVQFGLLGVAAAMAVAPMITWPLSFWWLSRKASIPVRRLWLGGIRIMVFCAVIMAASMTVEATTSHLPDLLRAALGLMAAIAAYFSLLLVPIYRRDVGGVLSAIRGGIATRNTRL